MELMEMQNGLMQSESFSEVFRVTVSVLCSIKFKIVMCLIQKFKNAYQLAVTINRNVANLTSHETTK